MHTRIEKQSHLISMTGYVASSARILVAFPNAPKISVSVENTEVVVGQSVALYQPEAQRHATKTSPNNSAKNVLGLGCCFLHV